MEGVLMAHSPVSARSRRALAERLGLPAEIGGNENEVGPDPGEDFRPEKAAVANIARQQERRAGAHDELRQAGNHGHEGVAHPLQGRAEHVEYVEDGQAGAHQVEKLTGVFDGLTAVGGGVDEKRENRPAQREHDAADAQGGQAAGDAARSHAASDAVKPARAVVLPGIGHEGIAVIDRSDFEKPIELVGRRISGDEGHAHGVDGGLDNHAADGDDGVLQGNGHPQA